MKGCLAPRNSQVNVAPMPSISISKGTRVRKLLQGNCTPPQVSPIRKLVKLAMKMKPPNQSTRSHFSLTELLLDLSLTATGTMARLKAQKGKLMMKTHLQDACCANSPPTKGPAIVPKAHMICIRLQYLGRCRRGMISPNITMMRAMMPHPPTPWIVRPASSSVKFCDRQQRSVPTVKSKIDNVRSSRRPKISERAAMKGWKTVHARR